MENLHSRDSLAEGVANRMCVCVHTTPEIIGSNVQQCVCVTCVCVCDVCVCVCDVCVCM